VATQNPDAIPTAETVKPGREQEDCEAAGPAGSWAAGVKARTQF